mgnify:CR=1 FL=1
MSFKDEQRPLFEASVVADSLCTERVRLRGGPVDYIYNTTETAWRAWIESARQAAVKFEDRDGHCGKCGRVRGGP